MAADHSHVAVMEPTTIPTENQKATAASKQQAADSPHSAALPETSCSSLATPSDMHSVQRIWSILNDLHNIEVPLWLGTLDSNWKPGKLMSEELVKSILLDPDTTEKYQELSKKHLQELACLLKVQFSTDLSFKMGHDQENRFRQMQKNIQKFENMMKKSETEKKTEDDNILFEEKTFDDQELYTFSEKEAEMNAKIIQFIRNKRAKGKCEVLAPNTQRAYIHSLMSLQREVSLLGYLKKTFKQETHIGHLMFRTNAKFTKLDDTIEQLFLPKNIGQEGHLGASSAQHMVGAATLLIEYLLLAALRVEISESMVAQQQNYKNYLDQLKIKIAGFSGRLNKLAKRHTMQKEVEHEYAEPGEREKQAEAYKEYFRFRITKL